MRPTFSILPGGSNRGERRHVTRDEAIRLTDEDASVARVSAAALGYIDDPFATLFLPATANVRKPPLINIGTHHRTISLDGLIMKFLRAPSPASPLSRREEGRNVVSLGSGSDSRFWRLRRRWQTQEPGVDWPVARWVEIDFRETAERKASLIAQDAHLQDWCSREPRQHRAGTPPVAGKEDSVHFTSDLYTIIGADLRSEDVGRSVLPTLLHLCPRHEPLLVLAELVFVYMPPARSSSLIRSFADSWSTGEEAAGLAALTYDLLYTGDPFGKQMKENLKARNLSLPGLAANPSVSSQSARLASAGFSDCWAVDMKQMRRNGFTREEMARIARLEMLDEVEELELVLEHYCIAFGILAGSRNKSWWSDRVFGPFIQAQ